MALLALLLLSPAGAISLDGLVDDYRAADLAVVLGTKVHPDGTPCQRLRDRLDRGAALFHAGSVRYVVLSGAIGREGRSEPQAMAAYLEAQGVPRERLILDHAGVNTRATAENTRRILDARGLRSAIAVSNYFHLSRCRLAFRQAGIAEVGTARSRFRPGLREPYALLREVAGLAAYALRLR